MSPVFDAPVLPVVPQKVFGPQFLNLPTRRPPEGLGLGRGGDFLALRIAQEQTIELNEFPAFEFLLLEGESFRREDLVGKTDGIVEGRTFGQLVQSSRQSQGRSRSHFRGVLGEKHFADFGRQGGAECLGQLILRSGPFGHQGARIEDGVGHKGRTAGKAGALEQGQLRGSSQAHLFRGDRAEGDRAALVAAAIVFDRDHLRGVSCGSKICALARRVG